MLREGYRDRKKKVFLGFTERSIPLEQQPPISLPRQQPLIAENASPKELSTLAHWLINVTLQSAQEISWCFSSKGSIPLTHFNHTIEQLNTAGQHMNDLLELLSKIRSLPPENVLSKIDSDYWQIMQDIYVVIADVNKLNLVLEKADPSDRQDITKKSDNLAARLVELNLLFQEE